MGGGSQVKCPSCRRASSAQRRGACGSFLGVSERARSPHLNPHPPRAPHLSQSSHATAASEFLASLLRHHLRLSCRLPSRLLHAPAESPLLSRELNFSAMDVSLQSLRGGHRSLRGGTPEPPGGTPEPPGGTPEPVVPSPAV